MWSLGSNLKRDLLSEFHYEIRFDKIHEVRREYFQVPLPASTMVEICKMSSPDYLIEINAIAVLPNA